MIDGLLLLASEGQDIILAPHLNRNLK